jgi:uncharacterized damage-inducible protein DinB
MLDHVAALAHYNRWMNDRLYAVSAELSDEERKRDLGAFFKSVHGTFNHLLLADRIWLGRFGAAEPFTFTTLGDELHADFDDLRRERAKVDDQLDAFVAGLTAERLAAPFPSVLRGVKVEYPLWYAVLHLFNHQTHHRGQVTTLLKQLGRDPGSTDLITLLRQPR